MTSADPGQRTDNTSVEQSDSEQTPQVAHVQPGSEPDPDTVPEGELPSGPVLPQADQVV